MLPLFTASLHALLCCLPVCHRYTVMVDNCWDMDPGKRATFAQLKKTIDRLLIASKAQDRPYMDLNFVVQEQLRGELYDDEISMKLLFGA